MCQHGSDVYLLGIQDRPTRTERALGSFVREQGIYECILNTAVSFPMCGQETKCRMKFLYIPKTICHENPLIFVATSLLLIHNGKEIKKRERERKEKDRRTNTREKGNKGGKCRGEKHHKSILLLFFQLHL